jgi:hypothetical protein
MIALKSSAFRDAPPTRAPSTSGDGEDLGRVRGLHRAAVEQADPVGGTGAEAVGEPAADMGVDLADLLERRGPAGADRPDRLVGDDEAGGRRALGDRARDLVADDGEGAAGVALRLGLADAHDGEQPGAPGGAGLGQNQRIVLAMIGAALRMADDHGHGAGFAQHLGRDVAGMRALRLGVAVLAAHRDAVSGERRDQGRGRADDDLGCGVGIGVADRRDQRGRVAGPVHLPVACHKHAPHLCLLPLSRRGLAEPGRRGQARAGRGYCPANLIDSPQPQASTTFGFRNLNPDSSRPCS